MASGGPYKNTLSNGGKKRCDRLMVPLIDDGQFLNFNLWFGSIKLLNEVEFEMPFDLRQ